MKTAIKSLEVFSDGSGAPAVVQVDGYVYACDRLGETKVTCISTPSGKLPKGQAARSFRAAREIYEGSLFQRVTDEWTHANQGMYAPKKEA